MNIDHVFTIGWWREFVPVSIAFLIESPTHHCGKNNFLGLGRVVIGFLFQCHCLIGNQHGYRVGGNATGRQPYLIPRQGTGCSSGQHTVRRGMIDEPVQATRDNISRCRDCFAIFVEGRGIHEQGGTPRRWAEVPTQGRQFNGFSRLQCARIDILDPWSIGHYQPVGQSTGISQVGNNNTVIAVCWRSKRDERISAIMIRVECQSLASGISDGKCGIERRIDRLGAHLHDPSFACYSFQPIKILPVAVRQATDRRIDCDILRLGQFVDIF